MTCLLGSPSVHFWSQRQDGHPKWPRSQRSGSPGALQSPCTDGAPTRKSKEGRSGRRPGGRRLPEQSWLCTRPCFHLRFCRRPLISQPPINNSSGWRHDLLCPVKLRSHGDTHASKGRNAGRQTGPREQIAGGPNTQSAPRVPESSPAPPEPSTGQCSQVPTTSSGTARAKGTHSPGSSRGSPAGSRAQSASRATLSPPPHPPCLSGSLPSSSHSVWETAAGLAAAARGTSEGA